MSCYIDPIPAACLMQCVDQLITVITKIIYLSLNCGEFPELLEHDLVRPLLKKPNLETELLKNYRPMPMFSLISKLRNLYVIKFRNIYLIIINMLSVNLNIVLFIAQKQQLSVSNMMSCVHLIGGEMPFSSCQIC